MSNPVGVTIDVIKEASADAATTFHRGVEALGTALAPQPAPPPSHKGRWLVLVLIAAIVAAAVVAVRVRAKQAPAVDPAGRTDEAEQGERRAAPAGAR